MADEEYSAYLKKQSYDDLVSISCSIDKEACADRYQMVLAEMALRGQQGEKLETEPSPVRTQPSVVARAVRLLYLSIAVSVVNFILVDSIIIRVDILSVLFLFIVCTWSAMAWLTHKIGVGCNWARIALFIWFLTGLPFWVHGFWRFFSYSIISDGLSLTGMVLQAVAFVMLFGREARSWFRPADTNSAIQTDDTKNST